MRTKYGSIVKIGKVIKVLTANVYKRRANLIDVVRYWLNKLGFDVKNNADKLKCG